MSPKLEWSDALGRLTRTEAVEEQGILTWDLVRTAILEGKADEALDWLQYIQDGENYTKPGGRPVASSTQGQLAYIAERYGEEYVEGALRYWRRKLIDAGGEPSYQMTPLERLQYHAEMERADYSGLDGVGFDVTEEADRYVMSLDPCGGCGKLRRLEADDAGAAVAKTSKPYAWSWGRADVPYYCAHNCLWWEIMSIEDIGYPVKVYEWSEDVAQPCRVFFYKDPSLIPEQYFARAGFEKDPAKFK